MSDKTESHATQASWLPKCCVPKPQSAIVSSWSLRSCHTGAADTAGYVSSPRRYNTERGRVQAGPLCLETSRSFWLATEHGHLCGPDLQRRSRSVCTTEQTSLGGLHATLYQSLISTADQTLFVALLLTLYPKEVSSLSIRHILRTDHCLSAATDELFDGCNASRTSAGTASNRAGFLHSRSLSTVTPSVSTAVATT